MRSSVRYYLVKIPWDVKFIMCCPTTTIVIDVKRDGSIVPMAILFSLLLEDIFAG